MPTALFLSPHLDDVAFSCGGLVALLHDAGWRALMATVFTRTIHPATGFALACQLDKGLGPEVDYMALRRAEDVEAATILGCEPLFLDFPEAPHRGYESAPALFGSIAEQDRIQPELESALRLLSQSAHPDLVFVPQGLGDHVDHRLVIAAACAVFPPARLSFYRDTPYAIRNPEAAARVGLSGLGPLVVDVAAGLERKIAAASTYRSQIGFQFGGVAALAASLRSFADREGGGRPAERFAAVSGVSLAGLERATM